MVEPGVAVDVRDRFEGSWSRGFEVAEVAGGAGEYRYLLRRVRGGALLPVWFSADDISRARDDPPRLAGASTKRSA